jgi:hypothetical protein
MKIIESEKLSSIWMKIFNDIACILIWIQIQVKTNGMQIGEKGITNIFMNMMLEKENFTKSHIRKETFLCF